MKGKRKIEVIEPNNQKSAKIEDMFDFHFNHELDPTVAEALMEAPAYSVPSSSMSVEEVGPIRYAQPCPDYINDIAVLRSFESFGVSAKLLENFKLVNGGDTTVRQTFLFNVMGRYMDLYNVSLNSDHMVLYCLHSLNHAIKTKNLVLGNNRKLQELREKGTLKEDDIECSRDQGFARPKVLILCPMRKDAFMIVECFRKLIFGVSEKSFVTNARRFRTEYGDNGYRVHDRKIVSDEYRELMSGNNDDCFRLGIAIAKKGLRLYTSFEKSDIIIASPLGIRMIIGDKSEVDREVTFLSSIEVLIVDKAEVLLMQNWEQLLQVIDSLHCAPEKIMTDISRVRRWSVNQQAKLYRQTIISSSVHLTECRAVFALRCFNFAGYVHLTPPSNGLLFEIEVPVSQELRRFEVETAADQSEERFNFFKNKIFLKCESGTLIFIPSYFDFVKVRNHLKRENESFVQLNEYAKQGKVAKARALFFRGEKKIMLVTERFHFFRRFFIKGIKSLLFYQPPALPSFYHEFVNMVSSPERVLVRLIYCALDADRMKNIFNDSYTAKLLQSDKNVHVLLSH